MRERCRFRVLLDTRTCEINTHVVGHDGCSAKIVMGYELAVQFLIQCLRRLYRTALNDNVDIDYLRAE